MAKINKYWGMVALGAVTAAAMGAVAAAFTKRRALEEAADLEEDFEDVPKSAEPTEEKEVREDFVSWEAAADEDTPDESDKNNNQEQTDETPDSVSSEAEGSEEEAVDQALKEAQKAADEFEEDLAEAAREQDEEEASIHID